MKEPIPITQHNLENNTVQTVSIGCVTYNHEKFIRNTIEGFLIQKTTFPVKIVIFEDCSTDKTASLIKEYQSKYPHIFKVFYQPENTYKKAIRQKAIEPYYEIHNQSKYIALCEGDDYWIDPLKLQKQFDFLESNPEYGLVYTEINRVNEEDEIIDEGFFKSDPASFCKSFEDYLIYVPFRAPCTWLLRRSIYTERKKRYIVGDLPLLLDYVANSLIHRLEDTTTHYRVLTKSASHFISLDQTYAFMKGIYEIQMDYAKKYNVSKEVVEAIKIKHAFVSYNFAVTQHDINQIEEANKLVIGHPYVTYKFKIIQLLSKFKIGRELVRIRLNRKLGYKHT